MDNETKTEEKKKIVKINTGGWRGVLRVHQSACKPDERKVH